MTVVLASDLCPTRKDFATVAALPLRAASRRRRRRGSRSGSQRAVAAGRKLKSLHAGRSRRLLCQSALSESLAEGGPASHSESPRVTPSHSASLRVSPRRHILSGPALPCCGEGSFGSQCSCRRRAGRRRQRCHRATVRARVGTGAGAAALACGGAPGLRAAHASRYARRHDERARPSSEMIGRAGKTGPPVVRPPRPGGDDRPARGTVD